MRERIILTIVVAFGGLCVAVVAQPYNDPYVAFWFTFGILESFMLCCINYLENGIFWLWGMDHNTRKRKEFEKRFKNKRF